LELCPWWLKAFSSQLYTPLFVAAELVAPEFVYNVVGKVGNNLQTFCKHRKFRDYFSIPAKYTTSKYNNKGRALGRVYQLIMVNILHKNKPLCSSICNTGFIKQIR
jgi:hypothetical protein